MSDRIIVVSGYADVLGHNDLTAREELATVDALNNIADDELVVWTPEWLADKKSLPPVGSSNQVFAGTLKHETEKAWLFVQPDGTEDWLPKSATVAFERAPGVELSTPKQCPDDQGGAA